MNKTEINAKLQYVFEGLPLSKVQKEMLGDVVMTIIETAIAGVTEPEIAKASDNSLGGIKTGYVQNAKNYPVSLDENGKAFVNVPWSDNDTTYNAATTNVLGLVKQATTVEVLEENDEIATVISTVNTLINNLKTAGIVANS